MLNALTIWSPPSVVLESWSRRNDTDGGVALSIFIEPDMVTDGHT